MDAILWYGLLVVITVIFIFAEKITEERGIKWVIISVAVCVAIALFLWASGVAPVALLR